MACTNHDSTQIRHSLGMINTSYQTSFQLPATPTASRRISLIFYISWHPPPTFYHHHWWTAEQTNKITGWPDISDLCGLASHYVLGHWLTTHLNVRVNWEFLKKHYQCPRIFPEDKHLNIPMWDDLCFLIPSLLQVILITASIENWEQKTIESIQVTV